MNFADLQRMSAPTAAPSASVPPSPPAAPAGVPTSTVSASPTSGKSLSSWFFGGSVLVIAMVIIYLLFRQKQQDAKIKQLKEQARHNLDDKGVRDNIVHFMRDPRNNAFIAQTVTPLLPWRAIMDRHTTEFLNALDSVESEKASKADETDDIDETVVDTTPTDETVTKAPKGEVEEEKEDAPGCEGGTCSIENRPVKTNAQPADFTPIE